MTLTFNVNTASKEEMFSHLKECDRYFLPTLSSRVDLLDYSSKLFEKSVSFEAWDENILIGMINAYLNDTSNRACFITNVSILQDYMGKGIASVLLEMCLENARKLSFNSVKLEVSRGNSPALKLYSRAGFKVLKESGDNLVLVCEIT